MKKYLLPTYFIDSDHPSIIEFAERHCDEKAADSEKAIQLYYKIRDSIRYNPYSIVPEKESMKASTVLKKGDGWCVAKAVLLAACLRSQGVPARLGFADVRNHLNTKRLKELMGTDLFVYHGYTDIHLNQKWVKATPAFNLTLCENFNVQPLEFDGTQDSIFHPFNKKGNRHMEYVKDHGRFSDLPWDTILEASKQHYPKYFERLNKANNDFAAEAKQENVQN